MNSPIISVLMTTYNREKYVGAAIESVLNSSFKDFELVVVDDRSKDKTVDIVREWQAKDDRVKLFINERNLGDYPNRNQAAAHATGKYLKYVDADDLIYPWGLQTLWECMERFPEAGWGLCSLAQDKARPFPFVLDTAEAYRYHYLGPGLFHKAPLSSIIKKDLFDAVGGFEPGRMVGDYEMWHRLALKSLVALMPQGVVWYRAHDDQESNVIGEFEEVYRQISLKHLHSEPNPLTPEELQLVAQLQRKKHLKFAAIYLAKGNFKLAQHSYRKAELTRQIAKV
jgi:glycosyltransferase involved in cell wall biosynthesis